MDRICYQLDLLLEFHTHLLPLLTLWCGYGFFTQNPQNSVFYNWLAEQIGKQPEISPDTGLATDSKKTQWEILSAADINLQFREDISISKRENEKITEEFDKFPEKQFLFSGAPLDKKHYKIDKLKQDLEGKLVWLNIHRLTLGILIALKLSLKQKVLVISDILEEEMWEAFRESKSYLEYPRELTPVFLPINKIHTLNTELLQTYNRIILDLGDELIPWVPQPFIENLLNLIAIIRHLAPKMNVSFFRPILIEEAAIRSILDHPPCPFHLESLNSEQKQQELLFVSILLLVAKRRHKAEFYQLIENYWILSFISKKYLEKIPTYVKELRYLGLIDRHHFQITTLGRWFLENKLFIYSFREFMQEVLPPLFSQRLQPPMSEELFKTFYFASTEWLFQITKFYGFSATKWTILHTVIIHTYRQQKKRAEELFDEVNDLIISFFRQEKEIHLKSDDYFKNKIKEFKKVSFKPPSYLPQRTVHWGNALSRALKDIHEWLNKLERKVDKEYLRPELPYFPIRLKARFAATRHKGIAEESYVRVVRRFFQGTPSPRQFATLTPSQKERVKNKITALRQKLILHKIKLKQNKSCYVLIKKSPCATIEPKISPWFYYLNYTCEDCSYFDLRKKDCLFFTLVHAINKRKIPLIYKERTNRQFSTKVACTFFRSLKPVLLEWPLSTLLKCLHCDQDFSSPPNKHNVVHCTCETRYKWTKHLKEDIHLIEISLSKDHSIIHDLALLISYISTDSLLRLRKTPSLLDSHIYFPQVDPPIPRLRKNKQKQYLFIQDSDKITYDPKREPSSLYVASFRGEITKYDLRTIHWIDTQRKSNLFFPIISKHPHIKFNFRQHNLILKLEDKAHILSLHSPPPLLNICYPRKRARIPNPEIIPLNKIASIFNVGKPRLTPILHDWGVEVHNKSTKGISADPEEEIKEALSLEGVRPILQEIHMLGLILSVLNATSQLYGLILSQEESLPAEFAFRVLTRLKRLLYRSSEQIYRYYFNYEGSLKQRSRFEAWFFRPFAEGVREFVQKAQSLTDPMLPQPYGRMIARIINPLFRQANEPYAAYTPFDTALNTMNRTLRNNLRLWNSKLGLGYNTVPIFSHVSKDRPGLSGHLDLEETGRIITRLILAQAIVNGEINRKHFQRRFTKVNYQIYYVPWDWTIKKLRQEFVHKRIFKNIELYYNHKWQLFPNAHRHHVTHLLECLVQCLNIPTSRERQDFLIKKYDPLIYKPRPISREVETAKSELYYLFDYSWVKWTIQSFKNLNLYSTKDAFPLINETLIERVH